MKIRLYYCLTALYCALHVDHLNTATQCSTSNPSRINNDIHLNGTDGSFSSPGFTSQPFYPRNMECTWIISGPLGYRIKLTFTSFNLEPKWSGACLNKDFVRVRNGLQPSSPVMGDYCGTVEAFSVQAAGRFMLVHFRSDSSIQGKGFSASYSAVKVTTKGTQKPIPVALIIFIVVVGVVVIIGAIIAVFYGGKKYKRRYTRTSNFMKSRLGSRVSMFSSESHLTKSAETFAGQRSTGSSLPPIRPNTGRKLLKHQWSVPKLIVTNEDGKEVNLTPKHRIATEVLIHQSPPFSRRRFSGHKSHNFIKPPVSVLPATPPPKRRNQVDVSDCNANATYVIKSGPSHRPTIESTLC